ncbi:hypothetical protein SDC9_70874 [bioreactor metagenome]|uniref:Uncharacterized protein n=1 Tax=bioreactor metagenome TaxID=1076179 RepID=A0A644Y721_9ZZZZ
MRQGVALSPHQAQLPGKAQDDAGGALALLDQQRLQRFFVGFVKGVCRHVAPPQFLK